jgi:hypothetical protein
VSAAVADVTPATSRGSSAFSRVRGNGRTGPRRTYSHVVPATARPGRKPSTANKTVNTYRCQAMVTFLYL